MSGPLAVMWSGGKDSALAAWRARMSGRELRWAVTAYDEATDRVRFHATRIDRVHAQVMAAGLEHLAVPTSPATFDDRVRAALSGLAARGCAGVVLGDIHLADVRTWYEERTTAAGLEHLEPLWGERPAALLQAAVREGFRAVITCVDRERLDPSWLGRVIDDVSASQLVALGIDACGENGEYHSYAFAGPVFRRPVPWALGERRSSGRFEQVDVLARLEDRIPPAVLPRA